MFRCDVCNTLTAPGTPATRVIVETRPRKYPRRHDAFLRSVSGKMKRFDDPGGSGQEPVKELICCPVCGRKLETQLEEQRAEA